jgi:hypothetical protein
VLWGVSLVNATNDYAPLTEEQLERINREIESESENSGKKVPSREETCAALTGFSEPFPADQVMGSWLNVEEVNFPLFFFKLISVITFVLML